MVKPGPVGMTSTSSWIGMEEQNHSLLQGKLTLLVNLGPFAEMFPWSSFFWLVPKQFLNLPSGCIMSFWEITSATMRYFLGLFFYTQEILTETYLAFFLFTVRTVQPLYHRLMPGKPFFWHSYSPWAWGSLDVPLQFFIKKHDLH